MKTLNKKLMAVAMIAFAMAVAPAVNAATVASLNNIINPVSSPLTFQGTNGPVTMTFSGAAPVRVAVGKDDIANQNYDTVGARVQSVFGISAFNPAGFQVDNAATIMTGNDANFTSTVAYNYLAIHFGKQEAFFDFGSKGVSVGSVFTIATSGSAAGLSNFRAYNSNVVVNNPISIVPIPAAAWLFGSGLVGLVGLGRKKVAASMKTV